MAIHLVADDDNEDEDGCPTTLVMFSDNDAPTVVELEEETGMVEQKIQLAVVGHHAPAALAALSVALQTVVVEMCRDEEAVTSFAQLFASALRQRWVFLKGPVAGEQPS